VCVPSFRRANNEESKLKLRQEQEEKEKKKKKRTNASKFLTNHKTFEKFKPF
jgi:hypothetical protein